MDDFQENGDVNDQALIQAIRRRLLEEIRSKRESGSAIVNNVYGSPSAGGSGIMGGLGGEDASGSDPREHDYFVDILRENIDPENPNMGWKKKVHRYAQPRGGDDGNLQPKKKVP